MSLLPVILMLTATVGASAQGRLALTPPGAAGDSLIERSLSIMDLPSFEWQGTPEPLRPRIGVYLNELPADTIRAMTGGKVPTRGFRVWQVMPHWPADEAGMLTGDILLTMNGKPIGDSTANGEEYIGIVARDMNPGDTARFTIIRNGAIGTLNVPVSAARRIPMPFNSPDVLGPVRSGTWLQRTIAEKGLDASTTTIKKQIRMVADQDFCTVPFAGRPSPWRLNAVTYLQHHPTRTGAYSRMIADDLWWSPGPHPEIVLSGAITSAAMRLDLPLGMFSTSVLPRTMDELIRFLGTIQPRLDKAYAPVHPKLDSITTQLIALLAPEGGWEDGIDTTSDPVRKREIRIETERNLAALLGAADKADLAAIADVARTLATLADTTWLRDVAKMVAPPKTPIHVDGVEGDVMGLWDTPNGRIVIGGPGPNRYANDFRFILDLGGDDIYELPPTPAGTFRFIGDVAGNDIYRSQLQGEGSGVGCVELLADVAGNDIYNAARYSQGAGLLGVGVLADFAGDDIYTSQWCSQGAAFLGIGLLYDRTGSDIYTAAMYSQGFGYSKGFGAIMERDGNDLYRAGWKYADPLARIAHRSYIAMSQGFGFGMRPWTTGIGTDGGIGIITDLDGDDLYASDFFSQGGSYWYGLGILHDARGSDRYTAGQYSQGSGIHLSFGALLDDAGDDSYDSYAWLDQGNAHDWSAGCLEDFEGNDTYRAAGAAQGSALNVSFAWLLDSHGDDQYYAHLNDTAQSQGGGNINKIRGSGGMGLLIDLGHGNDYYVEPRPVPGVPFVKMDRGIFYDDGLPPKRPF